MAEDRNPLVNQSDPTAGLAPNLTSDEPGTVGDRIPPISADLEQAGGVDDDENAVDPFHSGGTSETISGVDAVGSAVGDPTAGGSGTDVTSSNQAKAEPMPPTPAHGEAFGGSTADVGSAQAVAEPYPGAESSPATPAMSGSPGPGVETVRPAVAVPGRPDGEVDTRT